MPEEEYVAAFAELTKLCDITIAINVKKAEKKIDARKMASAQIIRNSEMEDNGSDQPPARYIRKSKSNLSQSENI